MRRRSFVLVCLLGCSSVDSAPNLGGTAAAPPTPTSAQIPKSEVERDLGLELTRASSGAMDEERDPRLDVWLVNKSTTRSHPVVLSNDGSESGWREPHTFFAVELQRPSGAWETAPEMGGIRCGLYAQDWTKDIVTLAPGQRVKMPWMTYPHSQIGDATKIRISAIYEYGAHARDKTKVPPLLHPMPEYRVMSAPMELPIEHPYALEVRLKGALPTTPESSIASAVDVIIENRTRGTLPVGTSESGAQLWFEVKLADPGPEGDGGTSLFLRTEPTYASKDILAAGARRSLVSAATKTDVVWELPKGRITKLRALWRIWDKDTKDDGNANVRRVESPWTDVPQPR